MPVSHGIDFHAAYQDPNWDVVGNWPLLAVKFTEGVHHRQWWPSARDDFLRMRERAQAGRHRWIGGYHVLRADFRVSDQVAHFLDAWDQVGGIQPGEFYQLDWEAWTYASPEVSTSRAARRFVDEMNAALHGVRGITYSSDWLPDSTLDADSRAEFFEWREENPATDEAAGLWYANYDTGPGPTGGPAEVALYDADIWQWSDKAVIPGFKDRVDVNEVQPRGFGLLDKISLRTAQPGPEVPGMSLAPNPITAIYEPVPAVTATMGPNGRRDRVFGLMADGTRQHLSGPDVASARAEGASTYAIEGIEHYDQIDGWATNT